MRFFRILAKSDRHCLLNEFGQLSESESHRIFSSLLESYSSSRIGIHAYLNGNNASGYYETGEENSRRTGLVSVKSWFFLTTKQTNEGTLVKGFIVGDPYIMCGIYGLFFIMLFDFLNSFSASALFHLILSGALGTLVLLKEYKNQKRLHDDILLTVKRAEKPY